MQTRYKKLFGILLSLVLVAGMLPAISMTVHADQPAVKYLDENGDVKYCTDYTLVTEGMSTTWNAGWYYVKDNVTFDSQITPDVDVHIILGDNAKLLLKGGFATGGNLSIYAQSTGENMGILEATPPSDTAIHAGKTITIAGGKIIAKANNNGGLGIISFAGDIIINGGHIIATTNLGDAIVAINNVFINNGNVEASASGSDSKGICASLGNIEIKGGNVIATGDAHALRAPKRYRKE